MRKIQDNRKRPFVGGAWLLGVLCLLLHLPFTGHWYEHDGTLCPTCPNIACPSKTSCAENKTACHDVHCVVGSCDECCAFAANDINAVCVRGIPQFPPIVAAMPVILGNNVFPQSIGKITATPYFAHAPPLRILPTTAPRAPPLSI